MARPRSDIALRLVRSARARFLRDGVDGASLREIAAAARTNIGMIYYYYPTKDDLFLAVVEQVYAGLESDVERALAARPGEPWEARLRRLYARIWRLSNDEFAVIRLVLREAMISSVRVRKVGARFMRGHLPAILGLLGDGVGSGSLRELPPLAQLVATMALGMAPVLASRIAAAGPLLQGAQLPPPEELAALFASVLVRGLGAPTASARPTPAGLASPAPRGTRRTASGTRRRRR